MKKDFSFKSSLVSVQVRRNTETKALNARNAKNAYTLHAQTLVTTNSKELNLVTELSIAQTVKLTVFFAVLLS